MLLHSHNITMPQSFAFSSTLVTVNDSVVPAAASQSVHVNGSVVPATASRPAHIQTVDDISALMSNMSINKPTVNKPTSASVLERIAERRRRVAANTAPPPVNTARSAYTASVLDRFAERRRRVAANTAPTVKDAASVNTAYTASVLDRLAERRRRVTANTTPSINNAPPIKKASIHDRIAERRRRNAIDVAPPVAAPVAPAVAPAVKKASIDDRIAERRLRVAANIDKGNTRGTARYCSGRPNKGGGRGELGYHTPRKGRLCTCRDHFKSTRKWHVRPKEWLTTPAESGRDRWQKPKKSNKRVHWPEEVATVFEGEKPWEQVLEARPTTRDWTTMEEDFPEGFCVTVN